MTLWQRLNSRWDAGPVPEDIQPVPSGEIHEQDISSTPNGDGRQTQQVREWMIESQDNKQ